MLDETYIRINESIAASFYNFKSANTLVFLEWSDQLAVDLSDKLTTDSPAHCEEVKNETIQRLGNYFDSPTFFRDLKKAINEWKFFRDNVPPPSVALILALTLAAEEMQSDDTMSANNFYSRFALLFNLRDESEQRFRKWYQAESAQVWGSLEEWLIKRNSGRLGLNVGNSQAQRLRHIGPALSQVLVRQADRPFIRHFFGEAQFRANQIVPQEELVRRLDAFLRRPSNSHRPLARKWIAQGAVSKSSSVHLMIADICSELLRDWDGSTNSAESDHKIEPLRLVIQADGSSQQISYLGVSVSSPTRDSSIILEPTTESSSAGLVALEASQVAQRLFLASIEQTGDSPEHYLSMFLNQRLKFRDTTLQCEYRRSPRRAVVLTRFGAYPNLFMEVPTNHRVDATEAVVVLVHTSLVEVMTKYLDLTTDKSYWHAPAVFADEQIPGWYVFGNVQILRQSAESLALLELQQNSDLQNLAPNRANSIQVIGGFRLPGRQQRYLQSCLPTITYFSVDAKEIRSTVLQSEEPPLTLNIEGQIASIDLQSIRPVSGTLTVKFEILHDTAVWKLQHVINISIYEPSDRDENWGAFRVVRAIDDNGEVVVVPLSSGARGVSGFRGIAGEKIDADENSIVSLADWSLQFGPKEEIAEKLKKAENSADFTEHWHMYKLPDTGATRKARGLPPIKLGEIVPLVCQDQECDRIWYFQPRPKPAGRKKQIRITDDAPFKFDLTNLQSEEVSKPSLYELKQALNIVGCGSTNDLFSMVAQLEGLERWEAVRFLETTGAIEIQLNETANGSWSAAMPGFVKNVEGRWKAYGSFPGRAHVVFNRLLSDASAVDMNIENIEKNTNQDHDYLLPLSLKPSQVLREMGLRDSFTEIPESSIALVENPIEELLRLFSSTFDHLIKQGVKSIPTIGGHFEFARWNVETWHFDEPDLALTTPGMYRIRRFGGSQIFACVTSNSLERQEMFTGSSSLMKLIWMIEAGFKIFAYEENQIILPGGMFLPPLIARAIHAANGTLPLKKRLNDGRVVMVYQNISKDIACRIGTIFNNCKVEV